MKYIQKIKSFSKKTLLLILGIIAGATFSVYAAGTWHGTDWIQTGEVISAQKIKDNFDYLYDLVNTSSNCGGRYVSPELTINHNNTLRTVAHGLGEVPMMVQISIINKVADREYEPGDIVILSPPVGTNTYQHWGNFILVDDVNIKVMDRKTLYIPRKTESSRPKQIKYENWKLIIKAI